MDQSESQQVFSNLLSPPNIQTQRDTQCGTVVPRLLDLSGPFKTKRGSAVIVPCSIQEPGKPSKRSPPPSSSWLRHFYIQPGFGDGDRSSQNWKFGVRGDNSSGPDCWGDVDDAAAALMVWCNPDLTGLLNVKMEQKLNWSCCSKIEEN